MKKRRPWRNRTLAFWLSIESVVVTLVTVAPFTALCAGSLLAKPDGVSMKL